MGFALDQLQTTNVVYSEVDISCKNFIDVAKFVDRYIFLPKLFELLDLPSMDCLALCFSMFVLSILFSRIAFAIFDQPHKFNYCVLLTCF